MEINEYLSYKQQENKLHTYDIILATNTEEGTEVTLTLTGKELEHPYENGLKLFRGGFINASQYDKTLNDNIRFCRYDWSSTRNFYCSFADIFAKYYSSYKVSITVGDIVTTAISFHLSEVQNPDAQLELAWPESGRSTKYNFDTFYVFIPELDPESGNPTGKLTSINLLDYQVEQIFDNGESVWTMYQEPEE